MRLRLRRAISRSRASNSSSFPLDPYLSPECPQDSSKGEFSGATGRDGDEVCIGWAHRGHSNGGGAEELLCFDCTKCELGGLTEASVGSEQKESIDSGWIRRGEGVDAEEGREGRKRR